MTSFNVCSIRNETLCVTGAGGFIGSWVVRCLLLEGYNVRGTLRNPDDHKNSHLKLFEGAQERLTLCKADLLDYDSLCTAFRGCNGVFHTASPLTDDPVEIPAAIDGTKNVINAAADVGIQRVVFTSTYGAVHMDPGRRLDKVVDESCWSNIEFCKKTKNWYCYAKTVAEHSAMGEAEKRRVKLLVVVPALTVGPTLQSTLNSSILTVLSYVSGTKKEYANAVFGLVDVRDLARAHVLLYENPTATGRYLCIESVMHRSEFVGMLAEMFPEYPITSRCRDVTNPRAKVYKFSNQRLKDLGVQFTPIKKSLYETVENLQKNGHLSKVQTLAPHPRSSL